MEFEHITTDAATKTYESANGVFRALLSEIRDLSKKKPDATLSTSKVKLINNVLADLLTFLIDQPEGKYLQILEIDDLPQVSDALMMMVQFGAALGAFHDRYYKYVKRGWATGTHHWITEENLKEWNEQGDDAETDDDADES